MDRQLLVQASIPSTHNTSDMRSLTKKQTEEEETCITHINQGPFWNLQSHRCLHHYGN